MWKQKPDSISAFIPNDESGRPTPGVSDAPGNGRHLAATFRPEHSLIGKGIVIRGAISGVDAITIEGAVEGTIDLPGQRVTIGHKGTVIGPRAGAETPCIAAREILIMGTVSGNVAAEERVEICANATLTGDVDTARVSIEDGAYFRGGIDIRSETKPPAGPVLVDTVETVPV